LAVRSVTKIYAGEIIERARKIQTQWLELSGEDQLTGLQSPPGSDDGENKPKEMRRGPLTPDHLREAFRRIRLERNGNVGLLGLGRHQHPTGAERFGIKTMGKRLFQ
jgi:transcription initiation factor TFIID subunit 11